MNEIMSINMRMKIEIEYYWNCDTLDYVPEGHNEALKEDAQERIMQMMKEGYVSGELITSVRYGQDKVPEEDSEEGLSYSGWFGIVTKEE